MTPQVHAVVQDARDFDRSVLCHPIQQQVAPASSMPSHVERVHVTHNVVAFFGACYVRSFGKLSNGLRQDCSISSCLSGAEIIGSPRKNADEITFRLRAKTNPPSLRGHTCYLADFEITSSESSLR